MSYLEKFTEEQRDLIVSLPYRTGLWVSESDDGGDDDADAAEMQALENIIMGYTEDFLKSELVEEIMKSTLERKAKWAEWSEGLDTVPRQCQQAIDAMNAHMESKEVLSFKQSLMEIATAVAMAYRELDDEQNSVEKMKAYARYYWETLMARIKKEQQPTLDSMLNISKSERAVLVKLSGALQIDMDGAPLPSGGAA